MNADRVVAIGGSLGSAAPLRGVCAALPDGFAAAVFVVVHTRGDGADLIVQNLRQRTALPVGLAEDGDPVEPGRIYIAPVDRHMLVIDGLVRLGRGPRENMARPAIDPLFRSIGLSYGPRAVAVLLTGLLNDGAAGLADLKRCGGIGVVQNPVDAAAPEMPLSALRASDVDYRASVADMPDLLVRLVAEGAPESPPVPEAVALEVQIALGRRADSRASRRWADTSSPCPARRAAARSRSCPAPRCGSAARSAMPSRATCLPTSRRMRSTRQSGSRCGSSRNAQR